MKKKMSKKLSVNIQLSLKFIVFVNNEKLAQVLGYIGNIYSESKNV